MFLHHYAFAAAVLFSGCQRCSIRSNQQALNEDQQTYIEWTSRKFGSIADSPYRNLSNNAKCQVETIWLAELDKGPNSKYYTGGYFEAINSLGAIRSQKAFKPLSEIAFDRREKDNRDRWMATRALGQIGDDRAVPELIHLVYHYNMNTRLWAQISLVQITGQNFGYDWQAWGTWWNEQDKKPAFDPAPIQWTTRSELADIDTYPEKDAGSIANKRR